MSENKKFDQQVDYQQTRIDLNGFDEPAPSDVAYNFGTSATGAAAVGVKVATYVASALALGGSLFVSNQMLVPANLQSADQANAAAQNGGQGAANGSSGDGAGSAGASSNASAAGQAESTAGADTTAAGAFAATGDDNSAFSLTSHGGKRLVAKLPAATTAAAPTPTQTADPAPTTAPDPSPSADNSVVLPPPTFSHSNTSNATQVATSGGTTSNFGDDEGDEREDEEGDDD